MRHEEGGRGWEAYRSRTALLELGARLALFVGPQILPHQGVHAAVELA